MSHYLPMFIIGAIAVVAAPLALFVLPMVLRKFADNREYKRRRDKRY